MEYSVNNDNNVVNKTNAASDLDIYFQTLPDTDNREEQNVFLGSFGNNEEEVQSNVISGMKIVEDVDVSDIGDILSAINSANAKIAETENEKALKQAEEAEKLHNEEIKRRKEEILKQRAEEEAELREQKRLEEEALLVAEEEKQKSKKKRDKDKKQGNIITDTAKSTVKEAIDNFSNIKKPEITIPDISNFKSNVNKINKDLFIKEESVNNKKTEGIVVKETSNSAEIISDMVSNTDNDINNKTEVIKGDDSIKEKPGKIKPIKNKTEKSKESKERKTINITIPNMPNINFNRTKKQEKTDTVTDNIDWKAKATTDSLTGLKNLTAYEEDCKTFPLIGTFIFADINNLKYVNDTLGHTAGDALILKTSQVLNKAFPNNVYRIGGDEFAILTTDNEKMVNKKITGVNESLNKLTKSDKKGIIYACAIGVAFGDGKQSLAKLKTIADANMYESKENYKAEHSELDIRNINSKDKNDIDWKELAMIDQKTKLKNKLALSMVKPVKTDTIALLRISHFNTFKREEGDRQIALIAELIKHNIDENDNAYFIDEGSFIIIFKQKKAGLDQIKIKARSLSLNTEITTLTGNNKPIEEIIDILKQKLDNKGVEEPKTYDEKLTMSQRKLKSVIKENHSIVQEDDFEQSLMQIQRKANDIIAVFMTDKSFNTLCIFFDVFDFLDKMYELQGSLDFSYIYAVYPGGALYYGSDEYTNDINNLFQKIAEGIQSSISISEKDIAKIDGINIFEKIFIA